MRRPSWGPSKCIELDLSRDESGNLDGSVGPFVTQHDEGKEEKFLIFAFHEEDDWEPVDGPIADRASDQPE